MAHLKETDKLSIKEYSKFVLNKFDIPYEEEDIDNLMFSYGLVYEEEAQDKG